MDLVFDEEKCVWREKPEPYTTIEVDSQETMEAIQIALSKASPSRPDIQGDGYCEGELVYDTWICPRCGEHYEIECDRYKYCPECGQAIDRTELDEMLE